MSTRVDGTLKYFGYLTKQEIKRAAKAEKKLAQNFISDGKVYLVNCPKCGKENYAMAVSHGQCVWCGYDADKDEKFKKTLREEK